MTRHFRRFALTTLLVPLAMIVAPSAVSHHGPDSMFQTANYAPTCQDGGSAYPGGSTFCRQQDSAVSLYRQSSLGATGQSQVAQSWQNQFNATDLQGTFVTPVYSGSEETDIIYQQGNPGDPNVLGATWCDDAVGNIICDQHYVFFASDTPGTPVTCHETGHAVGLTHANNASPASAGSDPAYYCMRSPNSGTGVLGAHNVHQINVNYS